MASWLAELRAENLRCFASATVALSPSVNIFFGGNGSGKTSLLEAIYLLGRGTSFRAARPELAIRHEAEQLTVFGRLEGAAATRVGVEISRGAGFSARVDGSPATRAALAASVAVQMLDPTSHGWVAGAPAERRQFLDWGAFHVERGFLAVWQRYRRALQQRNAALRAQRPDEAWAWDEALIQAGMALSLSRSAMVERLRSLTAAAAERLIGLRTELTYWPGWAIDESLERAIFDGHARDAAMGSTQAGPHRADLKIEVAERRARDHVSRGQEKLLAASLVLAQLELVAAEASLRPLLLVDEPSADLDREHLARLQSELWNGPSQVFVTALHADALTPPAGAKLFHVKQPGLIEPFAILDGLSRGV